jgi:Ca-activated chloride channel family protein
MMDECLMRRISGLMLAVTFLFALLGFQANPFKRGQSIYVFAAKDSRLLTMLPSTEEVKLAGGRTWKTNGQAMVNYPWDNAMSVHLMEDRVTLILPLPAFGTGKSVATARTVAGRSELDRVAPDLAIKARIEKEFVKRKEYVLADSPRNADYVFLAEGTYLPMQIGQLSVPNGVGFRPRGDYRAEFLQTVFGIVVPASEFHPESVDAVALVAARLWEGSATWQQRRLVAGLEVAPASPESLVTQFHNKEKRPASHFPLCAARADVLKTAGAAADALKGTPELKTNVAAPAISLSQQQQSSGNAIKVDVALVTVPVKVMDRDGKYVSDLKYSDFHVFEDDQEQKIDRIVPETEPFDVALMIDSSPSMRSRSDEIQTAARAFVDAIRPGDRVAAVSFDDRILVHSDFSADRFQLRSAISMVRTGEATRLYDALDLVVSDRMRQAAERKAIVLFTDGVDTRSRISDSADALAALEESNVLVYAIQYATESQTRSSGMGMPNVTAMVLQPEDARDNTARYKRADKFLYNLADASGGELYLAEPGSDLKEAFGRIAEQLRLQYTLCYYPRNQNHDGTLRRIRVEVERPGVKVRARTVYRAGK